MHIMTLVFALNEPTVDSRWQTCTMIWTRANAQWMYQILYSSGKTDPPLKEV